MLLLHLGVTGDRTLFSGFTFRHFTNKLETPSRPDTKAFEVSGVRESRWIRTNIPGFVALCSSVELCFRYGVAGFEPACVPNLFRPCFSRPARTKGVEALCSSVKLSSIVVPMRIELIAPDRQSGRLTITPRDQCLPVVKRSQRLLQNFCSRLV